ncbi:MAG: hypothetical protein ACTSP5_15720 [Candidatus Heimdallarchaeota archaeon]
MSYFQKNDDYFEQRLNDLFATKNKKVKQTKRLALDIEILMERKNTLDFREGAVSTIGSIRKFGMQGAIALPANPIAGIVGGMTVGFIYSIISVIQSLAAGIAADVVWTEGQNAKTSFNMVLQHSEPNVVV